MLKTIFGPAYTVAKRIELAAKEGVPLVVLLREDGTADIKLPTAVGTSYLVVRDREHYRFVAYNPDEVYRLPGGTPLIVVAAGVAGGINVQKIAWTRLLHDEELKSELKVRVASLVNAAPEQIDDDTLLEALIKQGDGWLPLSRAALYALVSPAAYSDRYQFYFEKKTITFLEQVLQLKLAYERGWRWLKYVAFVVLFIIFLAVLAWLIPQVAQAFRGVVVP